MRISAPLARALLVAALVATPSCRRLRHAAPARRTAARWFVTPAEGPALRLDARRVLMGALRITGDGAAPPPWPTSPLVTAARLREGRWLFASADGTVYASDRFDGPLSVRGAIEGRAAPFRIEDRRAVAPVHSEGALFVIDARRRAWAVSASGAPRRLPLERVVSGAFTSPDEVLAVVEPGRLVASRDGGEHFDEIAISEGVPLVLAEGERGVVVRTTAGTLAWTGALTVVANSADAGDASLDPRVATARRSALDGWPPLPSTPDAVVEGPGDAVSVLRDRVIVTLDARTGRERSRVAAPGEGCSIARARDGLRAVCRHEGWASAAFALRDGASAWETLRDELRAEPMGRAVFDPTSRAWVVAAPCRQRTLPDRRALCATLDDGRAVEIEAPFAPLPVAARDGVTLLVDGDARGAGPTRAALLRGATLTSFEMPVSADGARASKLAENNLFTWEIAPSGELTALLLGALTPSGVSWRRVEAPRGARRGAIASDGHAYVYGSDASVLAERARDGDFHALPSPVRGGAAGLTLDLEGPAFCAGAWCRLGSELALSRRGSSAAALIARDDPTPPPSFQRRLRATVDCAPSGPDLEGPDMDRGSAASGYAVTARAQGDAVTVVWYGATLRASATLRWPGRTDAPAVAIVALGAVGASAAAAVLERCSANGCDHALATPSGLTDLALGRAIPGGVRLHVAPEGWLVRADAMRDGVSLVTLVSLDPRGAARARRTYALADDPIHTAAGSFGARVGLWIRTDDRRMRFVAIDAASGETSPEVAESHATCAPDAPHEGDAHVIADMALARGRGWAVEPDEWMLDEVLYVGRGGSCVASLGGGEARDEAEAERESDRGPVKVRTFMLRAGPDGALRGTAWGGHRASPQRCEVTPR